MNFVWTKCCESQFLGPLCQSRYPNGTTKCTSSLAIQIIFLINHMSHSQTPQVMPSVHNFHKYSSYEAYNYNVNYSQAIDWCLLLIFLINQISNSDFSLSFMKLFLTLFPFHLVPIYWRLLPLNSLLLVTPHKSPYVCLKTKICHWLTC